ncbi:MAG: hypothetical protein HYV07_02575 [Deltaproteobacteria bacterium]|nr:hypothetical protein [Deltaproteobacteria bacterium]
MSHFLTGGATHRGRVILEGPRATEDVDWAPRPTARILTLVTTQMDAPLCWADRRLACLLLTLATSACSPQRGLRVEAPTQIGISSWIYVVRSGDRILAAIASSGEGKLEVELDDTAEAELVADALGYPCPLDELEVDSGRLFGPLEIELPPPLAQLTTSLSLNEAGEWIEQEARAAVLGWLNVSKDPCVTLDAYALRIDDSDTVTRSIAALPDGTTWVSTAGGRSYVLGHDGSLREVDPGVPGPTLDAFAGGDRLFLAGRGFLFVGAPDRGFEALPGLEGLTGATMRGVSVGGDDAYIVAATDSSTGALYRYADHHLERVAEIEDSRYARGALLSRANGEVVAALPAQPRVEIFGESGPRFSRLALRVYEFVSSLVELPSGELLAGTSTGRIFRFVDLDTWTPIPLGGMDFLELAVLTMTPIGDGLLFGSEDSSLQQVQGSVRCPSMSLGLIGFSNLWSLVPREDGFVALVEYESDVVRERNPEVQLLERAPGRACGAR